MYYVGVDYHLEVAVACITDAHGKEWKTLELPSTPEGMDILIDVMKGKKYRVLGEAFTYSIDLNNYLIGRGVTSDLVRPTDFRIVTSSNKKTDRHDARSIAWYLRLMDKGEIGLRPSLILKDEQRALRDLCRLREDISKNIGITNQRIRSHMRINAEYLPVEIFGDSPDLRIQKVQHFIITEFGDDFTLQELLRQQAFYIERSKAIDMELDRFPYDAESIDLLMRIPGIGKLSAVELMSMIVDISRFPSSDAMRSYFGMAPRVRNSGETISHGHLTKQGDPMMRKVLERIVASHMRWCKESKVTMKYHSVRARAAGGVAMMAAANKMLDVIYSVLTNRRPFRVRAIDEGAIGRANPIRCLRTFLQHPSALSK